jgi:RNA polymerase sigma-70 factor (ECF subfamily)
MTVELNEQVAAATDAETDKKRLLEKDVLLQRMESALNKLNPDQKVCVKLFYLQKKSYSEVAEITGFTLMQVKSYLQNGKRNLKLLIENNP